MNGKNKLNTPKKKVPSKLGESRIKFYGKDNHPHPSEKENGVGKIKLHQDIGVVWLIFMALCCLSGCLVVVVVWYPRKRITRAVISKCVSDCVRPKGNGDCSVLGPGYL